MAETKLTRAPLVASGDRITSAQYRGLARAFNDRLRLIGDLAWRISWYWFTLWRQVRNPDASGFLFPPQGEWFEIFQHIDPDYTMTNWPDAPPGEPEGANLANPMMSFVYGVGSIPDEPERMSIPVRLNGESPSLPSEYWELAKRQRGAYDPATGAQVTPAFDAAISLFRFQAGPFAPFHKSYGGWFPSPVVLLNHCGDALENGLNIPSYEYFFTALRPDAPTAGLHGTVGTNPAGLPTVTYAGSCPCGTLSHTAGHVVSITRGQLGYYVYVSRGDWDCNVDVDYLPARDWIEGPYDGEPYLAHDDGGQIPRAVSRHHVDFRGSDEQRADPSFKIERISFPNSAFFTRQYPLAPARGRYVGDGNIEPLYPRCSLGGSQLITAGTWAIWDGAGPEYRIGENFVAAGFFAQAQGLQSACVLEILDGDQRLGSMVLTPDSAGAAEALTYPSTATAAARLRIRPATDITFTSAAGSVVVEAAELLAWKPYYWDAYLVTRVAGSTGEDQLSVGVDGRGVDCDRAKAIGQDLLRWGCLTKPGAGYVRPQAEWVNDNPVYDAARRLTSDHVRIVPRRQLVAYEVANGKSIVYVKRFAYGLRNQRVDVFAGIAPPFDPVGDGDLVEGETYLVRAELGGSVTYRGATYRHNQQFVATSDPHFQGHGDGQIFVLEGVRHTARKRGMTNQWVMVMETKPYHPSVSSIWKPAGYTDYFSFANRCQIYPYTMPYVVRRHVAWNYQTRVSEDDFSVSRLPMALQTEIMAPESPAGYNYAGGSNGDYGSEEFCSSCQIYPSPYEVESCVVDTWGDDQLLKITFTGRVRAHPDAPASVDKDPTAWSAGEVSALRDETWRTDDNALREYVRHQAVGDYHASWKTGDCATGSGLPGLPDAPFGSCYPTFHFVHLVPEPFEDGNDRNDPADTRCLVDPFLQMETYARATCEAWVDARSSAEITCQTGQGGLYDYRFESLCFDAFQGRWIGAFDALTRPDGPPGFGPLPETRMWAEVFNRLAAAVNLLTKLRVDLPVIIEQRRHSGEATRTVEIQPEEVECSETGAVAVWADNATPEPVSSIAAVTDWEAGDLGVAAQSAGLDGCPFVLRSSRTDFEWRIVVNSPFDRAIPAWLQDMITADRMGMVALLETTRSRAHREVTDLESSDECCQVEAAPCPGHWSGGGGYLRWTVSQEVQQECRVLTGGILTAPPPLPGDFSLGRDPDMNEGVWCGAVSVSAVEVTLFPSTQYVEFRLQDPE